MWPRIIAMVKNMTFAIHVKETKLVGNEEQSLCNNTHNTG